MKQLLMLSGKGGTGKTTLTSAFIKMANLSYYADCDVDAPNLHVLNQIDESQRQEDSFYGMKKAVIDSKKCIGCGVCADHCRFGAINVPHINPYACEGCGVCERLCPIEAISMEAFEAGKMSWMDQEVKFVTAQLKMGYGNSGLLVTDIKEKLKSLTQAIDHEQMLVVIDGSPGIGCPVMASMAGVDLVLIVAEPSLSGISDMKRVVATAQNFNLPVMICVNKATINLALTQVIESYCREESIPYAGQIPYDSAVSQWVNGEKSLSHLSEEIQASIRGLWQVTQKALFQTSQVGALVQIDIIGTEDSKL